MPGALYRFAVQMRTLFVSGYSLPTVLSVKIDSVPFIACNVSIIVIYARSVIVQWSVPSGPRILWYRIQTFSSAAGTQNESNIYWENNATTVWIAQANGLLPCYPYYLFLETCNLAGCNSTPPISFKTAPDQPTGFNLVSVTTSSLNFSWNTNRNGMGSITYNLSIFQDSTSAGDSVINGEVLSSSQPQFSFVFQQLSDNQGVSNKALIDFTKPPSPYKTSSAYLDQIFRVGLQAVCFGLKSLPTFYAAVPSDVPEPPSLLFVSSLQEDSLSISWQPSPSTGVVSYRFIYSNTSLTCNNLNLVTSISFDVKAQLSTMTVNLTGVVLYSAYTVVVIGRTMNIQGYVCARSAILLTKDNSPANTARPIPIPQPGRVQELLLSYITDNSIGLSWQPPLGMVTYSYCIQQEASGQPYDPYCAFFENMQYLVTCTKNGSGPILKQTLISGVQSATIGPLNKSTVYLFQVQARNQNDLGFGKGAYILGTLMAGCATSACIVQDLGVAAYSSNDVSLTIAWNAPSEEQSVPFSSYKYQVLFGSPPAVIATDVETTYYRIDSSVVGSNLALMQPYTVQVRARNLYISSSSTYSWGKSVQILAQAYPPLTQPAIISYPSISALSLTSVTLTWTRPVDISNNFVYLIQMRYSNASLPFESVMISYTESAFVSGLSPSVYDFKVFASNLNEDGFSGSGSPFITVKLRGPLPSLNLRLSEVNGNSVLLSWDQPSLETDPFGLVYKFGIQKYTNSSRNFMKLSQTLVDFDSVVFYNATGLTLGQIYIFSVAAQDAAGLGNISQTFVRPFNPANAPDNLRVKVFEGFTNATGTVLEWTVPPLPASDLASIGLRILNYKGPVCFKCQNFLFKSEQCLVVVQLNSQMILHLPMLKLEFQRHSGLCIWCT